MTTLDHHGPDWQNTQNKIGHYSVFGVFPTRELMNQVLLKLKENGFSLEDISFVIPDRLENEDEDELNILNSGIKEGAIAGFSTGAVLGGVIGLLIGLGAFSFSASSSSVLFSKGPLLSLILGLIFGGIIGAICGVLIGYSIPELKTKKINHIFHSGGIFLSIKCIDSDWMNRAKKLLEIAGAQDIASTYEV